MYITYNLYVIGNLTSKVLVPYTKKINVEDFTLTKIRVISLQNNKLSNTLKQYQQHVEATKQIKHYAMAASHNTAMAAGLMPPTLGDPHNMSTCAMAMQQPVWDLQSARLPMLVAQDGPPSSLSDRSLGQHSDVNLQKAASVGSSGSGVEYLRSGGPKQSNQTTKLECPRCQREFTDVTAYRTHCHKCTDS